MSSQPTQADVLKAATRGALASVHTSLVCCVVSYEEASQTVTLKSCVKFKFRNQDGKIEAYEPPLFVNVPVMFPSSTIGGAVFSFVFPVSEGDEALLVFNERSLDEWKTGGGSQYESQSNRRFDLSDGVAVVGLRSPADPLDSDSYASDAAVLRGPKIIVKSDDLRLGSPSASDFVALSSLVEAEVAALWTAMNTHIHSGVTTGPGVSGVSGTAGSAGSVAATKVKAE